MARPAVSVVIPAFNAGRFLAETLDSVQKQRFRDYEIIVVDDGSTDDTAQIARSYPGLRYHYQANRGPAAARNAGFAMSCGRYLSFLDADDLWHEDMLNVCVGLLNGRSTISAVHTNWLYVDDRGDIVPQESGWQPWRGEIFERLLVSIPMINPAIVWRRQCFEEIGGFDLTPEVNDDWLNWLRIAHRGHIFECVKKPLAYYRKHAGNLTRTERYRVIEWRKRSLDILFAEVEVDAKLQDQAYGAAHWVKSMAALRESDAEEAVRQFQLAVARDEQILWRPETYYAIAYGGAGATTSDRLDIGQAEARLALFVASLEGQDEEEAGNNQRLDAVWAEAYLRLAQMTYGAEQASGGEARKYLWRAARANPVAILEPDRAVWAIRIMMGRRLTKLFRRNRNEHVH